MLWEICLKTVQVKAIKLKIENLISKNIAGLKIQAQIKLQNILYWHLSPWRAFNKHIYCPLNT